MFIIVITVIIFPPKVSAENIYPALEVISPQETSTVLGTKVTLSVVVGNFLFSDFNKKPNNNPDTPFEGHMHLWIDEDSPSGENASEIITHEDKILENFPPGTHKVQLELVKNDHSSFDPPIIKIVSFQTIVPAPLPTEIPMKISVYKKIMIYLSPEKIAAFLGGISLIWGLLVFISLVRKKYV
ncbi:MAG: hypothetical protein UU37_C0003G0009 [Candidatus Gottesmanbacteria bacterium GW2011_GWA2_41_12]|uniref:DUF4399 domain-containing protein n=2 Tax=Candidatus Gottesmaniibacteriota TaxID=1752720 RepID=A0A0G0WVH8_9BACT|nr:MAG: hypothetical protein UT63_C0014G0006 [Candidatus Gottesmanbacteria bacterium GW2011_GWC2_39_8]KKR88435.1 MAG: hypothetical protein UU37_C0003G0009 [Candidatus Gottesmanbacteria bacterium GW2011_GWA2_41_12]